MALVSEASYALEVRLLMFPCFCLMPLFHTETANEASQGAFTETHHITACAEQGNRARLCTSGLELGAWGGETERLEFAT